MKYKMFTGVVLTSLFLIPFTTDALTTDEIKAQIQSLLAQVQQLQVQIAQLQGAQTTATKSDGNADTDSPVWCTTYKTLAPGMYGDNVLALQKAMGDELGVAPTGFFGTLTRALWAKRCTPTINNVPSVKIPPANATPCNGVSVPCVTPPATTPPANATPCNGVSVPCVTPPATIPPTVNNPPATSGGTSCPMDAMRCADGSYVGRSGPNCTFTCPVSTTSYCVVSSNGQTTCPSTTGQSGSGSASGSAGSGATSGTSCTVPQKPSSTCSNGGVWNFIPTGGSANNTCNGSWQCVIGL